MERPSMVSQRTEKTRRPGATVLAVAFSLLLHAGGVLAFVVLPWDGEGERVVEVGGETAIDVTVVSGSHLGGAAGSGTPDTEGEARREDAESEPPESVPETEPEPVPDPAEMAEPPPEPEPESEQTPEPEPEPLPVIASETPSPDPVPPPPRARPAALEDRAEHDVPRETKTERAGETAQPRPSVERPKIDRPPQRTAKRSGQFARLGDADSAAEHAGRGETGADGGTGRAGAAPLAGNPAPDYPTRARRRGWEGRAILEVEVDEEGRPAEVRLVESSGYRLLDQAALETVERWRFTPARRGGKTEADTLKLPIRFALQ